MLQFNDGKPIYQLHHYCSPSVFLSLIKHKQFWLTSLSHSNDKAEGIWMLNHWLGKFDRRDSQKRSLRNGARIAVENVLRNHLALGTCFSEESDLLSQWRGYAQDGTGYSIAFNAEKLDDLARTQNDGLALSLSRIAYGNQDWSSINQVVGSLAQAFMEDAKKYSESADGIGSMSLNFTAEKHQTQRDTLRQLFTVKNSAFHEEKEWRLFSFISPYDIRELDYREHNQIISPFVRVGFDAELIESVTLGPTNPTPIHTVENALKTFGINANVNRSSASYRIK